MDAKLQDPKIEALILRNQQARRALGSHLVRWQRAMDVPLRVSESLRTHRHWWIAGSAALGVMASSLFRRSSATGSHERSAPPRRKGLLGLAFGATLALAKPALKSWLLEELQKRFLPTKPTNKKTIWPR